MVTATQLPIDTTATAEAMANAIFGNGVTVETATFTGNAAASGIYSNGDATAPGLTPADTGVILSTGRATDVTNATGDANQNGNTSTNFGTAGRADLNAIAGATTFDAAALEVTFTPEGSTLTMQIVFSSEEYLEYVNSGFNDAVGIFLNGQKATLALGDGDVTINNINTTSNENLYLDNPAATDPFNTEMDGLTVTMTLKAPVVPDTLNTIVIAIADGGDGVYDSNLLIAGNSIQTKLIAIDDTVDLQGFAPVELDVLANDQSTDALVLTITEINGQPVSPGQTITLPSGQMVTLTDAGTLSFVGDAEQSSDVLSYKVVDTAGNTDIGYVTMNTTPCFVAGALIRTADGEIPVEALTVGTRVITRDNGYQPLRWIGITEVQATDKHAPIDFLDGALGDHDALSLSLNHRVMVIWDHAELCFGVRKVLVKAKDLVNGTTVRRRVDSDATVTYVHLLFDAHEIIWGNGLTSESYHPGRETIDAFDPQTRREILELMPSLDKMTGYGYGPTARTVLKPHEVTIVRKDLAHQASSAAYARH